MKPRGVTDRKGIIAWFASNHVAANLLMYLIIVAGLLSASTIRKQMQPDFELNNVQVQVLYLGAAPQEVEEQIVARIEEAVSDLDNIEWVRSQSAEGYGGVYILSGRNLWAAVIAHSLANTVAFVESYRVGV